MSDVTTDVAKPDSSFRPLKNPEAQHQLKAISFG
jgi:hypothetical protein